MFSFFIFIYNISSEKKNTLFSILEKDWLFIQKYLLYFYLMFPFVFIFIFLLYVILFYYCFFNAFLCSLFPRKFLKFKGWPWIWGILTFFHDYFSKKCWNSMFFLKILMGFAFSTMIFRPEKNIFLFKCVAYICNVFQIDGINSFWRRSNHWKVAPTAGLF